MSIYPKSKQGGTPPPIVQLSGDNESLETPLTGAERLYSKGATRKIIAMALSARTDAQLTKLGMFVAAETVAQDLREQETTED